MSFHACRVWGMRMLCMIAMQCALVAAVRAESPALAEYAHDTWTTSQGLPHNSVLDIAQTRDGYLWFGTWEGLARYNGLDFTTFSRTSTPALPDSAISALHADAEGNLWTGDTRGNLGRRDADGRWRFWGGKAGVPQASITALVRDGDGRTWVAFERLGVGMLDAGGAFRLLPLPAGVPAVTGLHFALGRDGRLWLGTLDGLYRVDIDGLHAASGMGAPAGLVSPYRDAEGGVWLTAGGDIYRLAGDRFERVRHVADVRRFSVMLRDDHGDLWMGTDNQGLLRIGERGMEWVDARRGLPEGRITALFQDRENSLWVGVNGGLYRLRETLFSSYTREDGLVGNYVRALLPTRDGSLWIGGNNGLDRMLPDRRMVSVVLDRDHPDRGMSVMALAEGADGDVWVGTYGDNLIRLRDGHLVARHGPMPDLPGSHVRTLATGADGTVWMGTRRGVCVIAPDGRTRWLDAPGMPKGLVYALQVTAHGLWVGSGEGVVLWHDGVAEKIDVEAAADAHSVMDLYEDTAAGVMWMSTDRGLVRYRYRDRHLDHVGIEQGLPVDAVFQMVVDGQGSAWVGSNRGVLRADYAALMRRADDTDRKRLRVDLFGTLDGMVSSQGNGASGPTTVLRPDGSVWFATAGGAVTVQPDRLAHFQVLPPPPVVIERVTLDGQPVEASLTSRLRIEPGIGRLSIAYAGLSYLLPQGIRYRTRLDGFDRDWVERGDQRLAEFTSLAPGEYVFRVSAANADGRWNPQEAVLRFVVEPSLWQMPGFWIVLGLFALVLSIGLYRDRMARYRRNEARLRQLVDERTVDLQRQSERLLRVDAEREQLLTRLRQQTEDFERLAHEDPLTGLPNRRRFDEALAHEFARSRRSGEPWSLAMIDIDHFKQVNDRYSHAVGDAALRAVAGVLRTCDRGMDTVARLGGEEFALLMPHTTTEQAVGVCERLREAVRSHDCGGIAPGLAVTISIGVAAWPEHADAAAVMEAADAALYRAKAGGRDRVMSG